MNNTYRIFSLVAYEDSDTMNYSNIYNSLLKSSYFYFIIKHNNDNNKLHYHIAVYSQQPTTLKVISNKLNIPINYIKIQDDFGKRYTMKNTIGYLLHYNNSEKYNYSINDFITNNKDLLLKYYDILTGGNNENQELKEILLFLENNKFASRKDFLSYIIENNFLKTFKKYSYFLNQIIQENMTERY